jgi:hypothetical protein
LLLQEFHILACRLLQKWGHDREVAIAIGARADIGSQWESERADALVGKGIGEQLADVLQHNTAS